MSEAIPSVAEEHIASFVVHVTSQAIQAFNECYLDHPDIEILWDQTSSKAIALITTSSSKGVLAHLDEMQAFPGVISAALISHHVENTTDLDQQVSES